MNLKKVYQDFSFKNIKSNSSKLITLSQQQLDQLHRVLADIVDDIMLVCQENNLTCFLSGGTALGAIRDHRFIHWDDDVDLNMPRLSYEKFIPLFKKKYGDKYWIHTPEENPKYGLLISRIRKKGTKVKTRDDLIDDTEAGAYVDIFIVENVSDNVILKQIQGILCIVSKACLSCRRFYRDRRLMKQTTAYENELQNTSRIRLIIGFLCSFLSVERWTLLTNRIFSLCKNNHSKQVSIPAGRWHFFGELYNREEFCRTKLILCEGRSWPICVEIKKYMIQLYGDAYMEIPPESKREKHVCWEFNLNIK